MSNVLVIGAPSAVSRTLMRSIGAAMAVAIAEDIKLSSWSWYGWHHRDYQSTYIHKQMGWVSAAYREQHIQQSRKARHQRQVSDQQRRLKKEARRK